jgi:hypothetical protein
MKNQLTSLVANCPPYLLFLTAFGSVVAFGCFKLLALLQGLQGAV